jgi:hypothetical protein
MIGHSDLTLSTRWLKDAVMFFRHGGLLLVALMLGSACGPSQQAMQGQQDLLQKYITAVQTNQPKAAYALLNEDVRRRVSKAEFISRWKGVRKEMQDQAKQLQARVNKPIPAKAKVVYESGVEAKLSTSKDNFWKIDEGISVTFQTLTPIDAVRAFLNAVRAGQYRTVMSLMAEATRKEVERWLVEMEKSLSKGITVTGNRAEVRFGKDYFIKLTRVKDQWKILDFK